MYSTNLALVLEEILDEMGEYQLEFSHELDFEHLPMLRFEVGRNLGNYRHLEIPELSREEGLNYHLLGGPISEGLFLPELEFLVHCNAVSICFQN